MNKLMLIYTDLGCNEQYLFVIHLQRCFDYSMLNYTFIHRGLLVFQSPTRLLTMCMVVGVQTKIVFIILSMNHRYAFSRNGQPTIIPVPNPNVSIGRATQMSRRDILRVNILYGCSAYSDFKSSLTYITQRKSFF